MYYKMSIFLVCFSFIIYLQNINSIVRFDSFTKFPFGLLVLCLVTIMMDKCSRALCEHIQLQLFNRLIDDIEICQLLYYCRHLIILQVISSSLIFAGLAIAIYKPSRVEQSGSETVGSV
jgi:hypothetical protein